MGQARLKQRSAFEPELVAAWEADACVDFAVALAHVTNWLIHVDWWFPSMDPSEDIPIENAKPLRVYVADNGHSVFDVRGVRHIFEFTEKTIRPLAVRYGNGGVRTRFYSEAALANLPLSRQPSEAKVDIAEGAIRKNAAYLAAIPPRSSSCIPAYLAARFVYGLCVPFAEALRETTGLPAMAMLAVRFTPEFERTRRGSTGFVHSVVVHPDGEGEDSWGKAPLPEIAARFGVVEFTLSSEEHHAVAATLLKNTPDRFQQALDEARQAIVCHRGDLHAGMISSAKSA